MYPRYAETERLCYDANNYPSYDLFMFLYVVNDGMALRVGDSPIKFFCLSA